jgi:hypothetical protein
MRAIQRAAADLFELAKFFLIHHQPQMHNASTGLAQWIDAMADHDRVVFGAVFLYLVAKNIDLDGYWLIGSNSISDFF